MPLRRLVAPVAVVLACAACAPNGPPLPVAGKAAALEPDVEAELIEQAPPVTTVVPPAPDAVTDGASADRAVDTVDGGDEVPADAPRPMPESVAVIGDSIALSAQPIITATLESLGIDVIAYDAVESRRMVAGSASLPSGASAIGGVLEAGRRPDLWIVALGTNDVGAFAGADTVRADIEQILTLIPDDADVIWVDTWVRSRVDDAEVVNALLRESVAGRDETWVLDWPSRATNDALLISDGVHLSDVGKVEYARMIGDALRTTYARR